MGKVIIEEKVVEMFDREIKGNESNTWVSVPKRHQGKKCKVLVLQ